MLVEDSNSCRRYAARVVRGFKVGPSPAWLQERLASIGQRSVNNIVDVTNYVMQELGQPLHAYDLSTLSIEAGCPTVRVRRAVLGESLLTLDGQKRVLSPDDLIIADASGPVALAGVMGGHETQVQAGTVNVLLESAYFEATPIRQMSRSHGLRTAAAMLFERGANPGMVVKAVDRCAQMLSEIAEGEIAKGVLEITQKFEMSHEIALRLERIPRLLGLQLPPESVVALLEPLEIRCVGRTQASLIFETPSFRPDLSREIDLIEEIARRHGYDKIPERLPDTSQAYTHKPMALRVKDLARRSLLAAGLDETVSFGFGNPEHFAPYRGLYGEPVMLLNPLGLQTSAMRTSLLPGLLQVMAHNVRHGAKALRLFAVGETFHQRLEQACQTQADHVAALPDDAAVQREQLLPNEHSRVAFALLGGRCQGAWFERGETVDFTDLKGVIEQLIQSFGLKLQIRCEQAELPGLLPGCAAHVWVGEQHLGYAGAVDEAFLQMYELPELVYMCELSLELLHAVATQQPAAQYVPLPKYPKIRRDLAVVADKLLPAEDLRQWLQNHAGGALGPQVVERVWLFDVYHGQPIAKNQVSLAFAIDYRSLDRTLTDAEVGVVFESTQAALTKQFAVEVRK